MPPAGGGLASSLPQNRHAAALAAALPAPNRPPPQPPAQPPADNREEAEAKFQEISQAYERLMSTDEDQRVEQLGM